MYNLVLDHLVHYMTSIFVLQKGGVHIRGEICPRSDPDIAHMEYSMDPLKLS